MRLTRYLYSSTCVLLLTVLVTTVIYFGSLHTGFWGDDYFNLFGLNLVESDGYLRFIFTGIAGPSGRPISLLSFALQHQDWPLNSFPFKLVNLVIHLVNGILIFFISKKLSKYLSLREGEQKFMSLFVTALWLIHPLQITTVLYVVQRMTQLSALFILAGILLYLHFRDRYLENNTTSGMIGMGISVWLFMVLSVLSKENGILLPLFILILDKTIFGVPYKKAGLQKWSAIFLVSPLLIFLLYLGINFDRALSVYSTRSFSMSERLMTEAVVIFDYLSKIFLPFFSNFSLYNDDFTISRGLFTPPETFISIMGVFFLCLIGFLARKKLPVVSFAVFWFLGGHLLESTYLGLEIYFEHRNYLPVLGPCFLIGWSVIQLSRRINQVSYYALGIIIYFLVTTVTVVELNSYKNPYMKAVETATLRPDSLRAWSNLTDMYIVTRDYERFEKALAHIAEMHSDSLFPHLKKINVKGCHFEEDITKEDWGPVFSLIRTRDSFPRATIGELNEMVDEIVRNNCNHISPYDVVYLLVSLVRENHFDKFDEMLHELAAMMCIDIGDADCALENINQSINLLRSPNKFELKLNILIAVMDYNSAKQTLNDYLQYLKSDPYRYLAYRESYNKLESAIYNN